jgi:hypothetical protein
MHLLKFHKLLLLSVLLVRYAGHRLQLAGRSGAALPSVLSPSVLLIVVVDTRAHGRPLVTLVDAVMNRYCPKVLGSYRGEVSRPIDTLPGHLLTLVGLLIAH